MTPELHSRLLARAAAEILEVPLERLWPVLETAEPSAEHFVSVLVAQGEVPSDRAEVLATRLAEAVERWQQEADATHSPQMAPLRTPEAPGPAQATKWANIESTSFSDVGVVLPEMPGRYSFEREFARGGMGRVLTAYDRTLRRVVAIKELSRITEGGANGRGSETPRALINRFLQEAYIAGQMEHPSIVPVHEVGQRADGTYYYSMKYVRGQTLEEAIEAAGSLDERLKLLPNFVDLCQAVAYAHSLGVIHRDLKPSNVIVGEYGETIVIDWGLAKRRGDPDSQAQELSRTLHALHEETRDEDSSSGHTVAGEALGTPGYMPPEQARGEVDRLDERSDVFALGAVLYCLLTGGPPYEGATVQEAVQRARNAQPAPIEMREPQAPRELCAICRRAMQRNHERRYQSAKDLATEVQRFQSGALVETHDYGYGDYVRRFTERYRGILAVAAIALEIGRAHV